MLHQEFRQTIDMGDIILESPEISPSALDDGGEYDPAQSFLAFVKQSGYGQ
jgi:hypothetical protein